MDLSKMMKQAQHLQKEMADAQKRIDAIRVEGISGGGIVTVVLSGNGRMKSVSISKDLLGDQEYDILEDLVVAAYNEAWDKLEKKREEEMGGIMGGGGGGGFPLLG